MSQVFIKTDFPAMVFYDHLLSQESYFCIDQDSNQNLFIQNLFVSSISFLQHSQEYFTSMKLAFLIRLCWEEIKSFYVEILTFVL